ncbi:hypothetical protein FB451DRAFT_1550478 [Mycena latifolia]|nr:hypothetical protein FB451DRAFT_1550478 [Mycena latifolia]
MMRWKQRVQDGISRTETVEVFFSEHMKGKTAPDAAIIRGIAEKAQPVFQQVVAQNKIAKLEKHMYKPFVKYLQQLVQDFPSKPTFADTHARNFESLHPTDHDSQPDVSGSTPGRPAHNFKWEWGVTGTVIEFKFSADPIDTTGKPSQSQLADLVQLIQNARRITMASGCCYSFVVSIFGRHARLFRVDRSGYITTDAFNWTTNHLVFPEFLWRLYRGGEPGRILGADATLSIPLPREKVEMHAKLAQLTSLQTEYHKWTLAEATARSRWVDVVIDGVPKRCFTVGDPIFQSKGLFCRGTRVDRVLVEGEDPPQMHVMKDAWLQACRRPESDFYAVIQDYLKENKEKYGDDMPVGLTTCIGSYNLAESYPDDHRTITAALRKDGHTLQDRCHYRTVSKDVGFALDKYLDTKTLVQAMRDAINGHRFALEAGVLHRDVSVGNILIGESDLVGFVHDWDYSEFTPAGWERFRKLFPQAKVTDLDKSLKDMTGTYPFLAIDLLQARRVGSPCIHECKHDLESFYYILIWILLRYADHSSPDGEYACSLLFDKSLDALAIDVKVFYHQSSSSHGATGVPATHASVLAAFDTALSSDTWPQKDGPKPFVPPIVDQAVIDRALPPASHSASHHARSLPMSFAPSHGGSRALPPPPIPFSLAPDLKSNNSSTSDLKRKLDMVDNMEDETQLDDFEKEFRERLEERRKQLRAAAGKR